MILGGDWQIPTQAIWDELVKTSKDFNRKGYEFENNSQTLFLPAAGSVYAATFRDVGRLGFYWLGTSYNSSGTACLLHFNSGRVDEYVGSYRFYGNSLRPVRLVEVSQSQQ